MRFAIILNIVFYIFLSPFASAQTGLDQMLDLHNQERESLGLEPLQWSDELAEGAQKWAANMAFRNQASHSGSGHGENIWFGPNGSATVEEMFAMWLNEKANFIADQPVPENCTVAWENCGHYSQIVWSQSSQIGCAMAVSVDTDYVVCRYDPAGNVAGLKAYE